MVDIAVLLNEMESRRGKTQRGELHYSLCIRRKSHSRNRCHIFAVQLTVNMNQARSLSVLSFLLSILQTTDCFQWSQTQQSSHVINVYLGFNVTLPCEFLLSGQESQEIRQFHLVLWSRKIRGGVDWQSLASVTNIDALNSSLSQIIFPDTSKFGLINNSLVIVNVGLEDDMEYQCEVKTSFYTTPSVVKVNVVYKPVDTNIYSSKTTFSSGEKLQLNCTANANPKAGYSYFHNSKLVQNSTFAYLTVNTTNVLHGGEYTCIPWNYYGEGPKAVVNIKVKDSRKTVAKQMLSDEVIAGITGAAALAVVILIVTAIICKKQSEDKSPKNASSKSTLSSNNDVAGAHIGPGIYGSESSISKSDSNSNSPYKPRGESLTLDGPEIPDTQL